MAGDEGDDGTSPLRCVTDAELEAAYARLDDSEKPYARLREEPVRRFREEGRGCSPCVAFAASIYVRGEPAETFRRACRARRREDRQGIRSRRDHLLRSWRLVWIWKGCRADGFSMRGRGGRRQEFERWAGVALPDGGEGGRPGLLDTVSGPEVDPAAALADVEAWAGHLLDEADPVGHVERILVPPPEERPDPPDAPPEWQLVRLARRVERHREERRRRERDGRPGRRPGVRSLARQILADLSGGLVTPEQVRRLT